MNLWKICQLLLFCPILQIKSLNILLQSLLKTQKISLPLYTAITELTGVDSFVCKSTIDQLKILISTPTACQALICFLKTEKAEFHTFQLKEDKLLQVVFYNLHPFTSLDLIKEVLIEVRLFEIKQVTNVLHKVNKNRLPLFFMDLVSTSKSKEIFQLSFFCTLKLKYKSQYKSKTTSQCFKCQQYGHIRAYCGYQLRCVHCRGDHHSTDYPNSCDSLQNVSSVLKITRPIIKAAQSTKIFNFGKDSFYVPITFLQSSISHPMVREIFLIGRCS